MESISLRNMPTTLTPRETDVVRELLSAAGNKEIAFRLGITEGTVKCYFVHLANKLNVSNRVGIALWAERSGLFQEGVRRRRSPGRQGRCGARRKSIITSCSNAGLLLL